ncbi:MAG TPA: S-methyl-5-thioribose-1-phosphate isomerase [Candidatus Limnocylindrales bacterium]|nr:S-methyl-5-thioribose-1-phosphate isomerase [Candidatus Limnocylindrales bacterium]
MRDVEPIVYKAGRLFLLDQRKLPHREELLELHGAADTARAIRDMVVRGAPAIGVTAAFGLALQARKFSARRLREDFEKAAATLLAARPTAVNLKWGIDRLREVFERELERGGKASEPERIARALAREAQALMREDIEANRALGAAGAELLAKGDVLTHCNAGALATAGYGTALGVIRSAWESGRRFGVFATETRPFLQGARLTAWELVKLGIPVTLLTDGMAGSLLASGRVQSIVVGTDRTAANGDVANKIGTYTLAVLARRHGVPFYVAAPTSSIDLACPSGEHIPIEERSEKEVTHLGPRRVATEGVRVFNPAFDVTPAELVTAIITEHGVVKGDYGKGLRKVVRAAEEQRRTRREEQVGRR